MKPTLPLLVFLLSGACTTAANEPPPTPVMVSAMPGLAERDEAFDESAAASPQTLTGLGIKTNYDRLDDYTDAQAERQRALAERHLAEMKAQFDPQQLSEAGRLNYRLFEYNVLRGREAFRWREYGFPMSTNGSPAGSIPVFLINQHRVDSVADAEAYVARIRDSERAMGEISARVRAAAEKGIVPPKFNFAPVRADARKAIAGAPFGPGPDSPLLADFTKKVNALTAPPEEKQRLIAAAREALTGPYRRGMETMLATLDAVEPRAKGNAGAWSLPAGAEYYASRLRSQTTTDLSADEIHRTGLAEVARIHGEMERIKAGVGFKGTLRQFFQHIKTGPQFKYPGGLTRLHRAGDGKGAAMVQAPPQGAARGPRGRGLAAGDGVGRLLQPALARRVEAGHLLRQPCRHEPGAEAPDRGHRLSRGRSGTPFPDRARAGASGGPQVPPLRRLRRLFGRLGPLCRAGRARDGLLPGPVFAVRPPVARAVAGGPPRHRHRPPRQALLSERDIVKEVERYINNPGQATSYKIGQLKILELRERAKRELGDRFDIRDFHAAVLENGSLPLDLLEEQVAAYIAAKKKG
jgi:uncharacterized protein (DUF885 family)